MENIKSSKWILIIAAIVSFGSVAQAQQRYFYKGLGYGSEAMFNPVNLIINGGYDILQYDGYTHDVIHFPYRTGTDNVWRNISDPFEAISHYGWNEFLSHEVFPLSLNKKGAQWLPNYKLHLIGGGMTYRMMYEWYDYHHFPRPRILSMATMGAYHYLNEVVESGDYRGYDVDPIADIYIFDIGGVILFSFDGVNKFFSEKIKLTDWSMMPSFDLRKSTLQNQGQNFSAKWKPPFTQKWRLLYYFGDLGLSGLSYSLTDSTAISIAAGARAKTRYVLDENTHRQTVNLVWNCGLFYDRNNSLLFSLFLSGMEEKMIYSNLYPGVLRFGKFSPGLWFNIDRKGHPMFGLTTILLPGIVVD
jgi:hypothetical protein